jgi:hypothetical protein
MLSFIIQISFVSPAVNKIAAIQSRAVGSSSRIAVIAYSLLWLPLAVASMRFTPAPVTPGDTNTRWLSLLALTEAVKTLSNSALDASKRPRAVREELRSRVHFLDAESPNTREANQTAEPYENAVSSQLYYI